jgi:hypothetical protein
MCAVHKQKDAHGPSSGKDTEVLMSKSMKGIYVLAILALVLPVPFAAAADDELAVEVTTSVACDQVQFSIAVEGGTAPFTVYLEFGDEEFYAAADLTEMPIIVTHFYPSQGEWEWKLTVQDGVGMIGEGEGEITLEGPSVTLSSDPFPPLLTLESGQASIDFTAEVLGGTPPYTYAWDLDGDDAPDPGLDTEAASHTYSADGKFKPQVTVTDSCGFSASDRLTVVVIDPEKVSDEDCHPTALKIAEAVSALYPGQAEQIYTCGDIFDMFNGTTFGYQVGFGRMWHAFQLSMIIDDLTWEEIRDWHLDFGAWGALTQLNRFAALLDSYGIRDLMDLIISGEHTLGEVRTSVRFVLRYEADFEDALQRLSNGTSPGELGQFYKLASELGVETSQLDAYLAEGLTLAELRHAAGLAERLGAEWSAILEAKSASDSWGEIGQAYRLANEEYSAADILAMGVQEYRAMLRDEQHLQQDEERAAAEAERGLRIAQRLAEQFEVAPDFVLDLYNAECAGSWGCVRKALREAYGGEGAADHDARTAARIASQYGFSEVEVWNVFLTSCEERWNCVRAHFRELAP